MTGISSQTVRLDMLQYRNAVLRLGALQQKSFRRFQLPYRAFCRAVALGKIGTIIDAQYPTIRNEFRQSGAPEIGQAN
jgi:hypothetical protein